jgi:hypothetical protein
MRYIYVLIIVIFVYSCQSSNSSKSNAFILPDSILINNVILSVIKLDSLTYDHQIAKVLRKTKVETLDYLPISNAPMPPPRGGGYYYFQLYDIFQPNSNTEKNNDSIFFSIQSNRSEELLIARSIRLRFAHKSERDYAFYEPIFSSDKKSVYVKYWDNCGGLCGKCSASLLNWTGSEWIMSKRWYCGNR